jgi:hypothetical protein
MIEATWVPCPFSSTSAGSWQDWSGSSWQGPSTVATLAFTGMSTVKLRLTRLEKCRGTHRGQANGGVLPDDGAAGRGDGRPGGRG